MHGILRDRRLNEIASHRGKGERLLFAPNQPSRFLSTVQSIADHPIDVPAVESPSDRWPMANRSTNSRDSCLLATCAPGWTVDSVCSAASPPQGYNAAVAPGPCEAPPSRGPFIASDSAPPPPLPPRSTASRPASFPREPRPLRDPSADCSRSSLYRSPRG